MLAGMASIFYDRLHRAPGFFSMLKDVDHQMHRFFVLSGSLSMQQFATKITKVPVALTRTKVFFLA